MNQSVKLACLISSVLIAIAIYYKYKNITGALMAAILTLALTAVFFNNRRNVVFPTTEDLITVNDAAAI